MDKQWLNSVFPCSCGDYWKSNLKVIPNPDCKRCKWEQDNHLNNFNKLLNEK